MPSKTIRRNKADAKDDLAIVNKELRNLIEAYRNQDGKLDPKKRVSRRVSKIGKCPVQQKLLTNYIYEKHETRWKEASVNERAIRAKVQRAAAEFLKGEADVRKIFHFNPHHKKRKSPTPSRVSQAGAIKDIQKRLLELEDFKRRFEHMLQSGRPEPETPPNGKKAKTAGDN